MEIKTLWKGFSLMVIQVVLALPAHALDFPHASINNITCFSCHNIHGGGSDLLSTITPESPANIDDTQANNLCWSCHNDTVAPFQKTHSSHVIDNSYGDWNIECKECHNPHIQPQIYQYGSEAHLYNGIVSSVTANTLTKTGAGWQTDEYAGLVVFPDLSQSGLSYRILSNTNNTLTVDAPAGHELTAKGVAASDEFAIVYGKLIKEAIYTPNSGKKQVKFFNKTGPNSFADPGIIYDGICQVCHTKPGHMRNDGSAPDQSHLNVFGGTEGRQCTEECHIHNGGFGHGVGADGQRCVKCHGHEQGTLYDPDFTLPYEPGTEESWGRGTTTPHSTHTEFDADDKRGPQIYCNVCHDLGNIPNFKSGTDLNGDGKYSLAETDVCDDCHSPGGSYNGVVSENGSVGAKNNWQTGGVYNADGSLKEGREKWCAGCHDEEPSVIANQNNVSAPNVIGDEDGAYTYGTGWGFYKTGHGLPSDEFIPSGGNAKSGPGKICTNCHDSTMTHIDGSYRTFDCSDGCDSTEYRESYRLKQIDGENPMEVPLTDTNPMMSTDYFRLCFSCHTDNIEKFIGPKLDYWEDDPTAPYWQTNMISNGARPDTTTGPLNRHWTHLGEINGVRYRADYDYSQSYNSRPTCVTCHNVHGSTNLSMIRDGKLIDREPGLQLWYYNPAITTSTNPVVPADLPLTSSTGKVWNANSPENLCSDCHGGMLTRERTVFLDLTSQNPILSWAGLQFYMDDGVNPDAAGGNSEFTFRVEYKDTNNQAPNTIEVWVDENDNGTYEAGEKYAMTELDGADVDYFDGKIYTKALTLTKAGDNVIKYRFYAKDDPDLNESIGTATNDSTLYLLNAIPSMAWTAEADYESDGVDPGYSANGATYSFRVDYTDSENECPPGASDIQVWIDADDSGTYEAGEKHNMAAVDGGDVDCTDGKRYSYSAALSYAGDGDLNYRFYGHDGTDAATGDPTSSSVVKVSSSANYPPLLAHEAGNCRTDGVAPATGAADADITFTVSFKDGDNYCPSGSYIQVWIDENDNAVYDAGEKYDLTEVDGGDTDCTDGKLYATTRALAYAGDGVLKYRFYGTDGTDVAVGVPVSDANVTLVNGALKVRPTGGSGWYSTIQSAVDASGNPSTILVYPNADFTQANYIERITISGKANRTIQSVCGADLTKVTSSTALSTFSNADSANMVLDGFSITGATDSGDAGVYILCDAAACGEAGVEHVIKNSKIYGNETGVLINNSLGMPVKIQNSEIYSNTVRGINAGSNVALEISDSLIHSHNVAASGPALNLGSTASTTITRTTMRDNTGTGYGGAIYFNGTSPDSLTIVNSVFADNQGSEGGAIRFNGTTVVNIVNSTFTNNNATSSGGALFFCASPDATSGFHNNIFWGNTPAGDVIRKSCGSGAVGTYTYSNLSESDFTNATYTLSNNIDPAVDPLFMDPASDNYHLQPASPMEGQASAGYAPDDDIDSDSRPQGAGDDIGADELDVAGGGSNNLPTLAWAGETNYTGDGVSPDAGYSGKTFVFKVKYTDLDNDLPSVIQVWIDVNGDGAWGEGEKFAMTEEYASDADLTDGKIYTKSLIVTWEGGGEMTYRFYANDGSDEATDNPTLSNTFTVLNNVPTLAWTGEANYVVDGVHPDTGEGGSTFDFRVDYTDGDNTAPYAIEVWIDMDDSGAYDNGENFTLTETDAGDTDYTDGKRYALSKQLAYVGDGYINYRIFASDGMDDATGLPNLDKTITLTEPVNSAPTLTWVSEVCRTEGARPKEGASGGDFDFAVTYTDADNQAPGSIQVWIDENEDSVYGATEKHEMTEDDAGDTVYTDGKLYRLTRALSYAGDGVLNYRIYATDGVSEATGEPISDHTVSPMAGQKVRPEGGIGWDTSIQTAVDASSDGDAIIVYPNADFSAATYNERVTIVSNGKHNRTIKSACGPDLTIVSSSNTLSTFVFQDVNNPVVDGFSITGATDPGDAGIWINRDSAGTGTDFVFKNNKIYGNQIGIYVNDSNSTPVKIQNSEIYSNDTRGIGVLSDVTMEITDSVIHSQGTVGFPLASDGAGVYFNSTASVTIDRTIIRDNVTTGQGAGLYISAASPDIFTITNSIIVDNQAGNGGAISTNNGPILNIINSTIADNQATNGGAFYICASGTIVVRNSVFWNNTATTGNLGFKGCGAGYVGTYTDSNISMADFANATYTASSNIDPAQDPKFVNAAADNYHLQSGSPVADQASADYAPADDIDGDTRPKGSADDMGADEYLPPNNAPVLDWTGEANYVADGANPDSGPNGGDFIFRIDYTDADNEAPTVIQVWIDEDDSETYEATEKYDLTEVSGGDTTYTDGKHYTSAAIPVWHGGDGTLLYRFYAYDGSDDATGDGVTGGSLIISNTAPVLSWTGETNYTADGVAPNPGVNNGAFVFRVDYTDADNDPPSAVQLWVDVDDDSSYDATEKFDMTAVSAGDSTYTDGRRYVKTLSLPYRGDGTHNYRFYASDGGQDATGNPATGGTISIANAAPTLEWTGETNYVSDGVDPENGIGGSDFTFRVAYIDEDNNSPTSMQVWVDLDDDATYEANEKFDMAGVKLADADHTSTSSTYNPRGKQYTRTLTLAYAGDGDLNYTFYANDGVADATGDPTANKSITLTDGPPLLTWVGDTNYITDGAHPDTGISGLSFEFRVEYSDPENGAPAPIQLWIDIDDDGSYEANEKYNMAEVDVLDSTYSDGKDYSKTLVLNDAGDSVLKYRFYAYDGTSDATGTPTSDSTVTIGNAAPTLSWIGSTNYETDGVNPDSATDGSDFEFRVVYTDTDNTVPSTIQVWVDVDDSGAYEAGEKYDMTELDAGDTTYNDGKSFTKTLALSRANDNVFNYRFYGFDGSNTASGDPSNDGTVEVVNAVPTLAWTGEANYTSDGVDPDSVDNGANATFRIDYTDSDNDAPTAVQVWVDKNDDGDYLDAGEKVDMTETDALDTTYTDGKRYTVDVGLVKVGDNSLSYRFYATDSYDDATGTPASDKTVTVNNATPTLSWTGEANYIAKGVHPDNATTGSTFTFRVDYTDADNEAPSSIQVWVDEDDSGTYEAGEKYVMTVDGGDADYTNGERYTKDLVLTKTGDGTLIYRFYASDGWIDAAGTPTSNKSVTVTNNAPTLAWTGEANYTTDGVDPDSAAEGSNFTFRVKYTDANNHAPTVIQVWVDENDSGTYEAGEKYAMTVDGGDADYTNGELYTKTLALNWAGDGALNYRFYANDGYDAASGTPTVSTTVTIANNVPTLAWTGETNYAVDGVNPNSDSGNANFTFRVDFFDGDDEAPTVIEVWVDEDDSGSYEAGEKYAMTQQGGNGNYIDGERYSKTLAIAYAGDGTLTYRFYATDGKSAGVGAPASDSNLTVTNNVPTLAWTGETNYSTDGVDPESAAGGSSFTFRIDYTDADNHAPGSIQVWVDEDDSGTYEAGEKYAMTVDGGDSDYTNGERYTKTLAIAYDGDGSLTYRFYAYDGVDVATGSPTNNKSLTVTNNVPTMAWTGEANYTSDGVDPNSANSGSNFTFRMDYTDADNDAPTVVEIWVDENDGGTYSANEKYEMFVTGGDSDYTNGERYTRTLALNNAGDGSLTYRFYSSDGTDDATGDPVAGGSVTVVATPPSLTLHPSGTAVGDGVSYSSSAATDLDSNDGDTSYGLSTTTASDYYLAIDDTTQNGDINSVQVFAYVKDGGGCGGCKDQFTIGLKTNGASYFGSVLNANTSYTLHSGSLYSVNPQSGLAWTWDEVNNLVAIVDHTSQQDGLYVTELYVVVSITPNDIPGTPVNSTPADEATDISVSPTLTASAFSDPDVGDTHANSQWQVDDDANFSSTAYDSGTVADLESHTLGSSLSGGTTYYWRVRYQDNNGGWSNYSNGTSFTTVAGPPVAGTVYTDEGTTTIADGATVRLVINGLSVGTDTTVGGAYSINAAMSAGDVAIVYIDGHASDGTAVTELDGNSLAGLNVYADRLIVRHDNGGSLTNADMTTALGGYSDAEILYTTDGGNNLTVSGSGTELMVWAGDTYAPGAAIDTVHMDINGTLDAGANAISVAGNWDATGGVFTSTGTVTFDASSGTSTIIPGGTDADHDFQNIVFNDAAGTATFQLGGALDVDGTVTVSDGIFDTSGSNYAVTVAGNFSQSGGQVNGNASIFTVGGNFQADGSDDSTSFNSATLAINGAGSSIDYNNLASWWANGFNNLTVGQSGVTDTLNDWLTVRDTLTIGSGELTGAVTLALTKAGDVLNFDAASNLTIDTLMFLNFGGSQNLPTLTNGFGCDLSIAGGSSTMVVQTGAVTLNAGKSLLVTGDGNAGRALTYDTASFDLTVGGNITIGTGSDTAQKTLDGANSTITLGGNFILNDGGTPAAAFTSTGSTVVFNGTSQSIVGSVTFNNLIMVDGANDSVDVTLTFDNTATQMVNGTLQLNGIDADDRVNLVSDSPGTQWSLVLAASATKDIDFVDVTDSDASGSDASQLPVAPSNSVDGGNNTGWFAAAGPTVTACSSGADFTTIQGAIADAGTTDGYTVEVCSADSPWSENIDFLGKNITVKSTGGAASTTLQGGATYNTNPVVNFSGGETSSAVLDGFTLNNQQTTSTSRGIYISGATPMIKNSIIEGNTANNCGTVLLCGGGGVYINDSVPSFDNVTIRANTAENREGAGIYITGAGGGATITNSTIGGSAPADGNAGANNTRGAGIHYTSSTSGTLTITGSTIQNNVANGYGGGIFIENVSNATVITDSNIIENQTDQKAGGIYSIGSPLTLVNTAVDNNTASGNGGGIWINGDAADATITGGSVDGNTATAGHGAGFYIENGADLTFTGGSISSNLPGTSHWGGGIYTAHTGSVLTLSEMSIKGNKAGQHGAGVYVIAGSSATVSNSIISGNAAGAGSWEDGGGVYSNGTLYVYNSTIAGNYAGNGGGIHFAGGTAVIKNSVLWDNTAGDGSTHEIFGSPTVVYTDVEGGFTGSGSYEGDASGTGNLNLNPNFVTPAQASAGSPTSAGDFHIQAGSNVVDQAKATGTGVPGDDIDGDSRPLGGGIDMGADEKE